MRELEHELAVQREFHAAAAVIAFGVEELIADVEIVVAILFAHDGQAIRIAERRKILAIDAIRRIAEGKAVVHIVLIVAVDDDAAIAHVREVHQVFFGMGA
ncbi:hypothetical protein ACHMW6_13400 [Pseudoduganella sp. UC29_106]|uniref:hypothetical protein n=1 Tax=Pseudoduganella sp. UC29_106 TaxID=3374553 RepID=UPI0037564701